MTVGGDINRFLRVEKAHDVARKWSIDDGRSDQLIHRFVIRGVSRIVDETGAACIDTARKEGHAQGFVV